MTKSDAIVLVTGIVGVTAITIAKIVVDKKNSQKLTEQRDAFSASHKVDEMIDEASVDNEKLESAEDKALAKDIMVKCKAGLDTANNLDGFKTVSAKFLKLYSDLTEGSSDKVRANLLYFKRISDEADRAADRKALQAYEEKMLDKQHQNNLDKVRECRRMLEAIAPDSYTTGRILMRFLDKPTVKGTSETCTDDTTEATA